jgi:hypothetical protein
MAMRLSTKQINYRYFVDQAETAFLANKFLEAFLVQSCIIESVLKEYASTKLAPDLDRSATLKNKFKNFEFARLLDELLLTRNINIDLYDNLTKYKKKRNDIVHNILKHDDKKILNKELKEAYRLGKHMKGFIVEEMIKSRKGKTLAELAAKQEAFLSAFNMELPKAAEREFGPKIRKLHKDLRKLANKKEL